MGADEFNACCGDLYLNESDHTAMRVRNNGTADLLAEFSISETRGIDGEPDGRPDWA